MRGDWHNHASLAELEARYEGPDSFPDTGVTTFMIRNMPRSYNANAMMCELRLLSPRSNYDFVYLPWDDRRGSNITYAFVNFVDRESALRAFVALSGVAWSLARTTKPCRVSAAHVQGLAENLANYVAREGIQDDCPHGPIVFHYGNRIQLRHALTLFCTNDMLQMAAEAVRAKKCGLPEKIHPACPGLHPMSCVIDANVPDRRLTTATQFMRAFQEFCVNLARDDDVVDIHGDDEEDGIPSNIQFWMSFRDACLQFQENPTVMPGLKRTDYSTPAQKVKDAGMLSNFGLSEYGANCMVRPGDDKGNVASNGLSFVNSAQKVKDAGLLDHFGLSANVTHCMVRPRDDKGNVASNGLSFVSSTHFQAKNGTRGDIPYQAMVPFERSDVGVPDVNVVPIPKLLMSSRSYQ